MSQPQSTKDTERGSGSVLGLALLLVLFLLLILTGSIMAGLTANRQASKAADLAALSAADAARGLRPEDPCQLAQEIASANGAHLVACTAPAGHPGTIDVRVSVELAGPLAFLGPAQGLARAGPPPG